ncbi:hypothetical protein GDO81_023672 [Engystomops pustulosus]|uniref:Secreted protein n=1 Tax=Engystomops pustulosus TaxID=76066 RepID=A0AAV6YQ77_ENGPU|nr:hypothetical protein GDO81_023672 [Engystomops pustulosus]
MFWFLKAQSQISSSSWCLGSSSFRCTSSSLPLGIFISQASVLSSSLCLGSSSLCSKSSSWPLGSSGLSLGSLSPSGVWVP